MLLLFPRRETIPLLLSVTSRGRGLHNNGPPSSVAFTSSLITLLLLLLFLLLLLLFLLLRSCFALVKSPPTDASLAPLLLLFHFRAAIPLLLSVTSRD